VHVVILSPDAEADVDELVAHYEANDRLEAAQNLLRAVDVAKMRVGRAPGAGLAAPRPYPKLKRRGVKWIIEGNYWFAYIDQAEPMIIAVFYAAADIPNRF
jgi:plasmid stabilization system protein ParE